MAAITCVFGPTNSIQKANSPAGTSFRNLHSSLSSTLKLSTIKEFSKSPLQIQFAESIKMASQTLLNAVADTMFKFVDDPTCPFVQGNYAPVNEIGEAVKVAVTEGEVPTDFPQGVYIRSGGNPYFADKRKVVSPVGELSFTWFHGDGMVHATYFSKGSGGWSLSYKNKYVESEDFLMEKEKNQPLFLPAIEGPPPAVILAFILNMLRFGKVAKVLNNTNVFEHGGKVYTITENHLPYEINVSNLETRGAWDIGSAWDRPFTSHPKRIPGTGELLVMGVDANKPYNVLGVVSADGKKLVHKADLKLKACNLSHEFGVTENYNIIMDYPLRVGAEKLFAESGFVTYDGNGTTRIGVMPRYGEAESILWFEVKNGCSLHVINSFEDGDEVVVRGCKTFASIFPGPGSKVDKSDWYKRAYMQPPTYEAEGFDPKVDGVLFSRPYEWRLNLKTGTVTEFYLTKPDVAMDFPTMNNNFMGRKNRFAYAQVVDSVTSANTGVTNYNMFAKLYFDERDKGNEESTKVEYHVFEDNHFCSGLQFVQNPNGTDEDDGWLICYVHDENTSTSKVYIVDAKKFTKEPVTKITLPQRVPYGFHGTFVCA